MALGQMEMESRRLGPEINARGYTEFKPYVSDGVMYFVRTKNLQHLSQQSIWKSTYNFETKKWNKAEKLSDNLNVGNNCYAVCKVSKDQDTLYLNQIIASTEGKNKWQARIVQVVKKGTIWSFNEIYRIPFSNNGSADFWISEKDDLVFFATEKKKGKGKDIFKVVKDGKSWNEPEELKFLNTKFVEAAPFFDEVERILYLTSNRNGSFDIFGIQAKNPALSEWTILTSCDFNSSRFEGYYFEGKNVGKYYVGQAPGSEDLDLFSYGPEFFKKKKEDSYSRLKLEVVDDKGTKLNGFTVQFERVDKVDKTILKTNETKFNLVLGSEWNVVVTKQNYLKGKFAVKINSVSGLVEKQVKLIPMVVGTSCFVLENIAFDVNSAILKEEAHAELDKILKVMFDYPSLTIDVEGHTDETGGSSYNGKLSKQRAQVVCDYMIKKGMPAARLKPIGFGATMPICTKETEECRRKNRRVEFRISKIKN